MVERSSEERYLVFLLTVATTDKEPTKVEAYINGRLGLWLPSDGYELALVGEIGGPNGRTEVSD